MRLFLPVLLPFHQFSRWRASSLFDPSSQSFISFFLASYFLSYWCHPVHDKIVVIWVTPYIFLSLNFNVNALLPTMFLIDILSKWPNYCNNLHCNFSNIFSIPTSSIKISFLISCMMMAWTKYDNPDNKEYIIRLRVFKLSWENPKK